MVNCSTSARPARGDACGCYCPHCQTPLAAKKGKVKVHHFAHLGQTCAYVSVYDFLHIDHFVDTTLGLTQWANLEAGRYGPDRHPIESGR